MDGAEDDDQEDQGGFQGSGVQGLGFRTGALGVMGDNVGNIGGNLIGLCL